MKVPYKIIMLVIVIFFGECVFQVWKNAIEPAALVSLSNNAVNGSEVDAGIYRAAKQGTGLVRACFCFGYMLFVTFLFFPLGKYENNTKPTA